MSKRSSSLENKVTTYLTPQKMEFVKAYSKAHELSNSTVVEMAVTQFCHNIPADIRIQIVQQYRTEIAAKEK